MAKEFIEIHFSVDRMLGLTLHEWQEYLDTFNLDDAHTLFYSVLSKETRDDLHTYWKRRMLAMKNN